MSTVLKIIYKYWMKFARVLGKVQTTIILFLIYFIGVGTISIIAFIFKRDFLDKKFSDRPSFWRDRTSKIPTLEDSKRQF